MGPRGLTANLISPGYTAGTGFFHGTLTAQRRAALIDATHDGRAGQPGDIAETAYFLASAGPGTSPGRRCTSTAAPAPPGARTAGAAPFPPGHARPAPPAGQSFWSSVNPSGTMTSSRVTSWTDARPSPYRVSLIPWRRISSTLLTPCWPLAAMPHR